MQIIESCSAFQFGISAQFALGDDLAGILGALARRTQQRQTCWFTKVLMGQPGTEENTANHNTQA